MTRIVITTDGDDVSVEIHDGAASGTDEPGSETPAAAPGQDRPGVAGNGREADRFDRASATNAGGPPPELLEAIERDDAAGGSGSEPREGAGGSGDWPPTEERPEAGVYGGGRFDHPGVDRARD